MPSGGSASTRVGVLRRDADGHNYYEVVEVDATDRSAILTASYRALSTHPGTILLRVEVV